MNRHLSGRRFFAGERSTVADLALYAHTHVAQEGEFDLAGFPHVVDWLARIAGEPGHLRMTETQKEAVTA